MAKNTTPQQPRGPARLVISRGDAEHKLEERIKAGETLMSWAIRSPAELEAAQNEYYTWGDYNSELLARIFDNPQYKEEYEAWFPTGTSTNSTLVQKIGRLHEDIRDSCRRLRSLKDRLPLIETMENTPASAAAVGASTRVFIVHGHDEALKLDVARFVEKLGLQAIILSEQANHGRTIIEKFEAHAERVGFAIVLLTPDDYGGAKSQQNASSHRSRARQNVVLELGYFIGALGRARVCALHKGDIELPSDIHGVLYISAEQDWKLPLAKEMKTAKLPVDLNKALE